MSLITYSPDSTYYFFSTGAQSVAAIVGLVSAMAIFRYQSLLGQVDQVQAGILERFHPMVYPYLQKKGLAETYDAIAMPERRLDYLYDWINDHIDEPEFRLYLAQHVYGVPVDQFDERSKPMRAEVNFHGERVAHVMRFRRAILIVSAFGLLLLAFGQFGTLAPTLTALGPAGHLTLKAGFGFGLLAFMGAVFWLTSLSFQRLEW